MNVLKSIMAGLALTALATPALAQNNDTNVEGIKLYHTSMECAGAALAMPFLKSNMSKAEQDALGKKSEFWLGLPLKLAKRSVPMYPKIARRLLIA